MIFMEDYDCALTYLSRSEAFFSSRGKSESIWFSHGLIECPMDRPACVYSSNRCISWDI